MENIWRNKNFVSLRLEPLDKRLPREPLSDEAVALFLVKRSHGGDLARPGLSASAAEERSLPQKNAAHLC